MRIEDILEEGAMPAIAILRGVKPAEALGIGEALLAGGIRMMEVPLNSPEPLVSIERLAVAFGSLNTAGATCAPRSPAGDPRPLAGHCLVTTRAGRASIGPAGRIRRSRRGVREGSGPHVWSVRR